MSQAETYEALNLDAAQQQSFVRFFCSLPEKPSSTVRFFNRTDYYTLHDTDANLGAEFTSKGIKFMGNDPQLSYVCLNKNQFESFLRELLLVRQYRVEVYVKTSPSKNNDWQVEYKGSPGNLTQFEEILFENGNIDFSNSVVGIKIASNKVLAVACVNVTEVRFELCEINDNECFTELEALIAQIGPKECVIPGGDSAELTSLKNVLERNGVLVARSKRSDFDSEDIVQDLNRLLYFHEDQQRNAETMPEINLKEATGSLQAVIKFLNLTADERNFNQYKISKLDVNRYVRLDNAALYALNILPEPEANTAENAGISSENSKTFSLMGILDSCVTSQGKRLLLQWIKQPLKDINLINERLDVVVCLVKDPETRTRIANDCLTRIPDLLMLSKKITCKKAKLQDCYRVYQAVNSIPELMRVLRKTENKCVQAMFVDPISEITSDLEKFQSMIEEVLDMDLVDRGEFLVKSSFDADLNELFTRKRKIEEKMQKLLRNAADDLGFEEGKTIKLECNDQYGYYFRVTLKEEHALRQSKNYKILDAVKGGVRFTNNRLSDLNQEYSNINEEYEEKQKATVTEILQVAMGYADSLRNLNMLIATLDVLTSFANAAVSARIPYVRPKLHQAGTGILRLKKVRHPCLEQQDHIAFIPNDVEFDTSDKTLHVITGPNMCGKSTYIRSMAVCVLMAHIGSLVPCESAEISLVDGILARVGADDCQLKGLSTFMLEMIETSTIIKSATQNSLVVIDELGRGTSTYDGCGIAWAIAEHLAKEVKCFSLFATHYHEITKLAELYPSVSNLHVTAVTTDETITPLYQVREGECDKSYGIHCARMVGFPNDVIQWAIDYQKELEHRQGQKYIADHDVPLRRKIIEDGDKIVEETLKKVKSLDFQNMDDNVLKNILKNLKTELENSDNLFIKGLLST